MEKFSTALQQQMAAPVIPFLGMNFLIYGKHSTASVIPALSNCWLKYVTPEAAQKSLRIS